MVSNVLYRVGRQLYRLEPNPPGATRCGRCAFRFTSCKTGKCGIFGSHCFGIYAVARRIPSGLRIPSTVTIVECGP